MSTLDLPSSSVRRAVLLALCWCAFGGALAAQDSGWLQSEALLHPRRLMAAAEQGGRIYTFGGCGSPCFAPPLHTSTFEETLVEVFEIPASSDSQCRSVRGCWSSREPMASIVFGAAAAAPDTAGDQNIYLFGGFVTGRSTQAYDPQQRTWTPRRAMPTSRHGLAAVAFDGKIYVIGGSNGTTALAALEIYHPDSNTWETGPPMPTPRAFLGATVLDGKIYAIGGAPDCCGNQATAAVEIYDPDGRRWTSGPPLLRAMQTSAAATVDDRIYVLGGFIPGEGTTGATFEYDPVDGWRAKDEMRPSRDQAPAVVLQDGIHVLGGSTNCHCSALQDHPRFVPALADLQITKKDDPPQACPGETVNYEITVKNNGPAAVHGAQVTDTFPMSLTNANWTCSTASEGARCGAQGGSGRSIDETVDLPVGAAVKYEIEGTIALDASGTLLNQARVSPPDGVTDPEGSNDACPPDLNMTNDACAVDGVVVRRDLLEVTKTRMPPTATVAPLDLVSYEIRVTNQCAIPLSTTIVDRLSDTGLESTGPNIDETVLLEANSSITYRASGTVPCNCRNPPLRISNEASATAGGQEPASGVDDVPVAPPPSDGLAVEISGPDVLVDCAGEYTITVTNSGPCTAPDVVLELVPPSDLTLVSLSEPCGTPCSGTVELGDIARTASRMIKAHFETADGLQCPIAAPQRIEATVHSGCRQPEVADSFDVELPCDLAITKTDHLDQAAPGDCIAYSIDVENLGCGAVAGAKIVDFFPSALDDLPCAPAPINAGSLPTLQPGASASFQVSATISPKFVGTLSNTASVVTDFVDSRPENNSSTDVTTVAPLPGVAALCDGMEGGVLEGQAVSFTFVLWNGGPAAQADNPGDEFVDALPAGLTLVSAVASSGTISTVGNTVSWNGAIPVGGMVTIEVTATVDVGAVDMTLCNVATVFFDADGDGINESSAPSDGCLPCCVSVVPVPLIPTLSWLAVVGLALLLAALGLARLRGRSA